MMAGKEKKLLMVVVVLLATIALSVDAKPTADKGEIHFGYVSSKSSQGCKSSFLNGTEFSSSSKKISVTYQFSVQFSSRE